MKKGFTLIEILLVVSIMAILAGAIVFVSFGIRARKDLDTSVNSLAAVVRDAQQKSITQEDTKKWGIYLEVKNGVATYGLEKDNNSNITVRYLLPPSLAFDTTGWSNPTPGNFNKEVVFSPIDGLPFGGGVTIKVQINNDPTSVKPITISSNGTISY